jgi:acyl carrier protein
MSDLPVGASTFTLPDIREWLAERVAFYLEEPRHTIDPDASLLEMGFDSVYAMTLSGDVEEQFGLELEPTIAWDHRTVAELAVAISSELSLSSERARSSDRGVPGD